MRWQVIEIMAKTFLVAVHEELHQWLLKTQHAEVDLTRKPKQPSIAELMDRVFCKARENGLEPLSEPSPPSSRESDYPYPQENKEVLDKVDAILVNGDEVTIIQLKSNVDFLKGLLKSKPSRKSSSRQPRAAG